MKTRIWLSLLAAVVLFGCGGNKPEGMNLPNSPAPPAPVLPAAPPCPAGTTCKDQTISSGGLTRNYILHTPSKYDGTTAVPLVFVLHGYGSSADAMHADTGFDEKSDAENFVVVYPNGAAPSHSWNSGIDPNGGSTADDITFFRDLIAKLESEYNIDSNRIYATGLSNGAAMSHHIAALMPDVIAAVAPVEGAVGMSPDGVQPFKIQTTPTKPISIAIIHQRTDTHIPYEGGYLNGGGCNSISAVSLPTSDNDDQVVDTLSFWTSADKCTTPPQFTHFGPSDPVSYCDCYCKAHPLTNFAVEISDYQDCGDGIEVLHVALVGGDHAWPKPGVCTTPPKVPKECATQADIPPECASKGPCNSFSANDAIWDFFKRHTLGH